METSQSSSAVSGTTKKSAVIKWALILAIAIVTNLFVSYAIQVIYPEPVYESFCPEKQVNKAIESEEACVAGGGQWNENVAPAIESLPVSKGYCNEDFVCSQQYEDALSLYNRNVFIIFVAVGILLLVGSVFLSGSQATSLGLSFGGVLALIIGSVRYWSDMDDILRVILLGVALSALLWLAWKKFQD